MKGGGEMKLPRKLKDGVEYKTTAAGCNVTFALYGWEGREEEIKDKFNKSNFSIIKKILSILSMQ